MPRRRYKYKTAPKSLLIGPIFDSDGDKVVGLIEMVNKTDEEVTAALPAATAAPPTATAESAHI